jgi:hypothetical protein
MADVLKIRLANLRALIEQWEGTGNLARKLGYTNASTLAQMAGRNPNRPITEKMARKVEKDLDLPAGWMDAPHRVTDGVDQNQVTQAIQAVGAALQDAGKNIDPAKFAEIVALVYEYAPPGKSVEFAQRIIKIA